MIDKLNQQLKTLDLVGLLFLMGLSLGVVVVTGARQLQDGRHEIAKIESENLALQLISGGFYGVPTKSRGIASNDDSDEPQRFMMGLFNSEGQIGQDPWGGNYHYRLVEEKGESYLVVWSPGPNKSIETIDTELVLAKFSGDDVGNRVAMNVTASSRRD